MKRVFYGIHSHTTKIYFVSPTRIIDDWTIHDCLFLHSCGIT